MPKVVLIVHNVRSALNVGSILRTAEGLGVEKVFLSGYTPYPEAKNDDRLPHLRQKNSLQIHKTALGAENYIAWERIPDIAECLSKIKDEGFVTIALEQTPKAQQLVGLKVSEPVALVVGNEVTGLEANVLKKIKTHVKIPMSGHKESFNVAVAAAIALYHLRYLA
jgi:23S rRNA (guanosine2251-2'-O)-methyltransferase